MATAQATTRTASGPPGKGALAALRERPALAKILALLVVAAVAVPLAHARWGGGVWPGALTVDLSGPLGEVNDWIIGNRDSHPLFLYFFGHISNAVVLSVRGVYLALLALGWAGVTAVAALVAWRTAGRRLALTAGLSFLLCGLLGMWVPTMQTLALMVVAVLVSVVLGLLLGLAGASRTVRSVSCAPSWTPCRCCPPSRICCPSCWCSASACPVRSSPPSSTRRPRWHGSRRSDCAGPTPV